MYQIKCDDYILYDPRDEELTLLDASCNLEVNTVCEGSFTIYKNHPFFSRMRKLKSVFEFRQDNDVLFRGRMTEHSRDFYNTFMCDLEGILAVTNDTQIAPFSFPEDFFDDAGYIEASANGNIIEFFLNWVLGKHNEHASDWQKLKLGNVTVTDPNNYLSRSSDKYLSTWEVLKTKLFESELGGYLFVRYEDDGNYVDYVDQFPLTNTQRITIDGNLLDLKDVENANETYSVILPLGAEIENDDGTKAILDLSTLPDGDLTDDLVKEGVYIYSKSAREQYGWVCVPTADSTWEDVTEVGNLQSKAIEYLVGTAILVANTITVKAVDLHCTDDEIQAIKPYRNILVNSSAHELDDKTYALTKLHVDIFNPQNTDITVGDTVRTLVDIEQQKDSEIGNLISDINRVNSNIAEVKNQMLLQTTQIVADCESIIMSALEDYVETSNFESFQQVVSSQLQVLADEIAMTFTTTTEQITNVDGDLQSKFTQLYKFISFSGDTAITIGSGDSSITLEIDNEKGIVFKKNGVQFGLWDGENFYTGNIVVQVNERAQFGNFAFVPRSDGSLAFLKVGD